MAVNPRSANGSRRRKLVRAVLSTECDCWLCGDPVDLDLRGVYVVNARGRRMLHPDAPVVDEMRPVSHGGSPYDRANCHLAHARCNAYRGNRLDIENVQRELRGGKPGDDRRRTKPTASQRW